MYTITKGLCMRLLIILKRPQISLRERNLFCRIGKLFFNFQDLPLTMHPPTNCNARFLFDNNYTLISYGPRGQRNPQYNEAATTTDRLASTGSMISMAPSVSSLKVGSEHSHVLSRHKRNYAYPCIVLASAVQRRAIGPR